MEDKKGKKTVKTTPPTAEQQEKTKNYLTLEEALQEALKKGRLEWYLKDDDDEQEEEGEKEGKELDEEQKAFIEALSVNTATKAEFNRLCKRDRKVKCTDERTGNTHRRQAIHPPEVAIPNAVKVYNNALPYYIENNGNLPAYSYQIACSDRDRYRDERDEAREERDEAREERDQAKKQLQQKNHTIQRNEKIIRSLQQELQKWKAEYKAPIKKTEPTSPKVMVKKEKEDTTDQTKPKKEDKE